MKIMKLLMCIAILFIVACDSSDGGGGLAPTTDNLQGTWDITNTCYTGTYPDYAGSCESFPPGGFCIDTYEDYGYDAWVIIADNNITSCNNEAGNTYCDYSTFILSGNSIVITDSYGESESYTLSLSSDGSWGTTAQSFNGYGCSATITQTWNKQ